MKPVSELLRDRQGPLRTVRPELSVFEALQLLADYEVGALVVMEGARMVGIVSERDYTRKVALQGRNSRETRVRSIRLRASCRTPFTTSAPITTAVSQNRVGRLRLERTRS